MLNSTALTLTMQEVVKVMQRQGLHAKFQRENGQGNIGRIAATVNGINFFLNFFGKADQFGALGFFTIVPNNSGRTGIEVNAFNEAIRCAKVVIAGENLCLMHDVVVSPKGLTEDIFLANLEFWNFAMSEFGKWILGK